MAKLRLIVKQKSKAEQSAHDLRKAAAFLQDTSSYLKQIALYLEETSYVNITSVVAESPCKLAPTRTVNPTVQTTSGSGAEDEEAALILANIRTGKAYTSADMEAAAALTIMQMGSSAGTGVVQEESVSVHAPISPRVLRSRPVKVIKKAPKTVPNQTKQNTILAYLQSSLTVHSIKDLEKTLPSVASINGMQVKDFLQALSDEGQIRVEKIGSGNWYWSFASEAKKERTDTMCKLREEKEKIDTSLSELTAKVNEANALRNQDPDRAGLIERRLALENDVEGLRKELEGYKDRDPGEVDRRRKDIKAYQMKADKWTDNIGILEGQMLTAIGGDREKLDGIKREIYGDEYAEGEGLREL